MTEHDPTYRTGIATVQPLDGQELARLAELLDRYLHHRRWRAGRPPEPAVEQLRAEIATAAGVTR